MTQAPWFVALHDWPRAAIESLSMHATVVRVIVADVRGSAPRDTGTSMLVDSRQVLGTIGGGQLEHRAIETARKLLNAGTNAIELQRYVLATHLAQCCGGVVELCFERYERRDLPTLHAIHAAMGTRQTLRITSVATGIERRILSNPVMVARLHRRADSIAWDEPLGSTQPSVWIYGAGHVGQALIRLLADLPIALTWIDSRPEVIPNSPPHIRVIQACDPVATIAQAPACSHFVVMTHDHALDYALCRAILQRADAAWAGVIGSLSKAARFRSRLARDGESADRIATLTCPIGIDGIHNKEPAAIAIAVAAQLLRVFEASTPFPVSLAKTAVSCVDAGGPDGCAGCELAKASQ